MRFRTARTSCLPSAPISDCRLSCLKLPIWDGEALINRMRVCSSGSMLGLSRILGARQPADSVGQAILSGRQLRLAASLQGLAGVLTFRLPTRAEVAELADALDSGSSGRKVVGVQVPPSAPVASPIFQTQPLAGEPSLAGCRAESYPLERQPSRQSTPPGRLPSHRVKPPGAP